MKPAQFVSATQLVRDLAAIRTMTNQGPVGITSHGRTELIVLNALRFSELSANGGSSEAELLEAKLGNVLDSIDTHVAIIDNKMRVLRINRAMRLSVPFPEEPLRGRSIHELLPQELAGYLVKRLVEAHRSGRIAEFDFASILNPGRTIHVRMVPWPGGISYFSEDITDRLASIERDMELGAFREASAALGGRGSGVIADNGEFCKADAGLCAMTGIDASEIEGRKFLSLFDHPSRPKVEAALDWRRGKASLLEVDYLGSGIEIGTARLSLAPYFSRDGKPCYAFILADKAAG